MSRDLTNLFIDETFQYLTQISGSNQDILLDGVGNQITELDITASNSISSSHSVTAVSSSYSNTSTSASHAIAADTSILADTASLLIGNAEQVSHIDFAVGGDATVERRLTWNDTDGTLNVGLKGGNVTLQVGQEEVARVVNGTGTNLLEAQYRAVKVIGAQGQRLQVDFAQANSDINSATTLGLVTENINNNQEGFITTQGTVNKVNTTGALQGEVWNDGDVLYLSATTPGVLTNVKPLTPAHLIVVGFVEYAHQNNGKIYVKVDNGYELEELHDVLITNPTNGEALVYENGIWINSDVPHISASYAVSSSQAENANTATSASYAVTASYALNAGAGDSFPYTGSAIISGSLTVIGDTSLQLVNGDNNSVATVSKGNSSYAFAINQFPGFTGSIISALGVDEFKITGDTALALDNTGYAGTNDVSLKASKDILLQPTGRVKVTGSLDVETFGTISLTGDSPGINRNIIDSTGADFTVIRSDSGIEIDNRAGTGSVSVYTNGNMQFEPQGDLDFYTPTGRINLTAASANLTATSGGINATSTDNISFTSTTGNADFTGKDINFFLKDGDNTSSAKFSKGNSSYLFGVNQFPGFTGSILTALEVDEFKITGDTALAIDNSGFAGTNNVSLKASRDVILEADDQVRLTSNTTDDFQGVSVNAPNFRVNLSRTGSGAGDFALSAPGGGGDTPGMLLSLGTGSYGDNPTTANMLFTGDDAFFSAVGNFYIKNVFNDTGSITVWSESELELRGDTGVRIQGDRFSNPNDPIEIDIQGSTFMDSFTSGIMAFQPQIGTYTRVTDFQRAFVETPLTINAQGTVEVQTGATLKVINEL